MRSSESSLALKITIASFCVFFGILSSIIGSSYLYSRNDAYKNFAMKVASIQTEKKFLRDIGGIPISPLSDIPGSGLPQSRGKGGPRDFLIMNTNGTILKNNFVELSAEELETLKSIDMEHIEKKTIDDESFLVYRMSLGENSIFLFEDIGRISRFHMSLILIALLGMGIGVFFIYFLARYLARITIAPIQEHNRELESYSHNVAHELRTPLSVMRSNLDLLRIKPDDRFINSTEEEIKGMEHIIDTLLFLAQPDKKTEIKELNLTDKTKNLIEKYQSHTQIRFSSGKKHIKKIIAEELYNRILSNLIDNAIKYGSKNEINITLTETSLEVRNPIENDIVEDHLKNLTQAFYQEDTSRNSDGYGLGLALVEKIVNLSGWKMTITANNKQFIVKIEF